MSYHNTSSPSSSPALQRQAAPPGYHYMPDGSLMLDLQMAQPSVPLVEEEEALPELNEDIEGPDEDVEQEGLINNLTINVAEMPTAETVRDFKVQGTIGSQFIIHVVQDGTIKYYDFVLQSFTNGHISNNNNLKVTLSNRVYNGSIIFPSGGGTYVIKLTPLLDTKLMSNKNIITKVITKQSSNATITFKAFTSNTNSYATFPTSTSTGALTDTDKFSFDWDITNASTDANGFGLIPTNDFEDLNNVTAPWFYSTTETVDGAVAPTDINGGFVVKVDDLTDIGIGSYISAVSAGSLVGNPIVININTEAKEITINIAQTFANDITLTFRADGVVNIKKAIGVDLSFAFDKLDQEKFTETNGLVKTVRAGSSGTTVNLNGTYGVGHNDTLAKISGVGITKASVVSVGASSSAGSMVVSISQGTLTVGTTISFSNIVQVFNVTGSIKLSSYSSANQTIYLDIDKFLTPGTAS